MSSQDEPTTSPTTRTPTTDYEKLPDVIRRLYTAKEYAWSDKSRLLANELEPEWDE